MLFFEVTKDPQKPFFVYTDKAVTKVLGTSFLINTRAAGNQFTVLVKTGIVSVFAQAATRQENNYQVPDAVLTANQQAVFDGKSQRVVQRALEPEEVQRLAVPDTDFSFQKTPVKVVLQRLSEAYSTPIAFDEDALKNCDITASFTDEPFAVKLDLICRTIGVEYHLNNAGVVISGTGCAP